MTFLDIRKTMENKEIILDQLRSRLSSKEPIENLIKDIVKLKGGKDKMLLFLQGSFLSMKKYFDTNQISLEEYRRYENNTRVTLFDLLDDFEITKKFTILDSTIERTKKIIEDLEKIAAKKDYYDDIIWSISFMSIFAIE